MSGEKRAEEFEHKGRVLRAEIDTSATPQQAWEAWADPEKIAHWLWIARRAKQRRAER
jgi:uncharacterized protein YndB with AHSA1/START domain